MKNRYTLLILSGLLLFNYNVSLAQIVGDNVFLQGAYVEIGIAPNGGYGSTFSAPAGYHPHLGTTFTFYDPGAGTSTTSGTLLGFVADYGRDGWAVGTPPSFGDFYMPGHPQEGWAIEFNGGQAEAYIPSYLTFGTTGYTGGMTGTNVGYSNTGGIIKGVWQGSKGTMAIRQTTVLDSTKLYFTVNVVLTNTGVAPLTNIYYLRTLDPDNEETVTDGGIPGAGSYTTINTIAYQLPNPGNKVLVSTTGVTYTNDYLGLGTKDCRAKCMIFTTGLDPAVSCDSLWHELPAPGFGGYSIYPVGTGSTSDVGIGLVYNIGTLNPGDSTSLTYAYILNAAYIDSALNATLPGFTVNGTHYDSTDTINLCDYPGDSITVNILDGAFYTWTWSPDSFLHHVSGTTTVIHSDSINSNITYTITGTNTAGGCDSIKYRLVLTHLTFTAAPLPPVTYCQFAPAVPLTSPGTGLLWYTAPTGGVGSPTAPTPSTLIPGMTIYYVTETVGLCQSLRNPDTVIVIPLPPPPYITGVNPYCFGQTFVPFTVAGTGVLWYTTATGGVGTPVAPVINTTIPGNDTFWASQTVNGCEGPRQMIVTTVLNPIIPLYDYSIHYGCKGDTILFTNNTIGALNYLWSFGDGVTDTAKNPSHIYYTQDTFRIKLVAINNQCADSVIDTVPLIHPINAAFKFDPGIVCQKDPVTFTDSSIGTGISYMWYFGNGETSTAQNPVYTYTNTGEYHVKLVVTDFIPCHDTATGTIYVDSISAIRMAVTDSVLCRSTYITLTGNYSGIGNTGVTWYFGEGDSIKNVNPVSHAYDVTGKYTVTVVAHYRACKDTSVKKDIWIYPTPSVNLGADTTICPGSKSIVIGDHENTAAMGAKWKWNTGQTTPTITVVEPGHYSVIVNINGCYSTDTILVENDCYMNIPNVFTPNGDGLNEYFFPREYLTKGLTSFHMEIFNRWGQQIFETNSIDGKGWDGRLNDVPQPVGVYIYTIDATFKDGQKEHHQGNITLLR
jgi:gliding motility-associated-like protein